MKLDSDCSYSFILDNKFYKVTFEDVAITKSLTGHTFQTGNLLLIGEYHLKESTSKVLGGFNLMGNEDGVLLSDVDKAIEEIIFKGIDKD